MSIFVSGLVTNVAEAQTSYEIDCQPEKVCREQETLLPLRALPRPYSHLYKSKDNDPGNILAENVKAFSPVYVFAREELDLSDPAEPKGWYQVGPTVKQPLGWMQAKDVMEWRQALVVSYTHPGTGEDARKPVLMFKTLGDLQGIVDASDYDAQAERIYDQIQNEQIPANVISIEPSRFVDIDNDFYILPVLDYKMVDRFDDETRLLNIAAAVPQRRSDETDKTILLDADFRREATSDVVLQNEAARELAVNIVFVMDLTASMGPFIDLTRDAVIKIAEKVIKDPKLNEAVKFGIVGYRDDVRMMPTLQFTAKNFTPQLLTGTDFVELVEKQVKEAEVGSEDYAEEVYAGVKLALDKTAWGNGLRFIVLVGDASAHETGHPQSTTGLGAAELRRLADDADVSAFAVHLREERAKSDHPAAQTQFSAIANNPGTQQPALFQVDVVQQSDYESVVREITGRISAAIAEARQSGSISPDKVAAGKVGSDVLRDLVEADAADAQPQEADVANTRAQENSRMIDQVISAALVNYLGGKPVRDIAFWAMDRDITDPGKRSLDVRVLISREDLSNLILALERVVDAIATAEFTQMQFFESLRAILSQVTKGQDINLDNAQRLAQTGLMPKWIESLPYRSTILDMSDARFEALTPDERAGLERSLKAKLQLYREISEKVDAWQPLDERAEGANRNVVYPLPLDYLP